MPPAVAAAGIGAAGALGGGLLQNRAQGRALSAEQQSLNQQLAYQRERDAVEQQRYDAAQQRYNQQYAQYQQQMQMRNRMLAGLASRYGGGKFADLFRIMGGGGGGQPGAGAGAAPTGGM